MASHTPEAEWTFGFVDLAGFTALTEAHGDTDALALVERFEAKVVTSLSAEDQLVKTIGDAVMLRFPTATSAVTATAAIFDQCMSEPGFPVPRAGLHHGSAIVRGDDWYGATVNLAARVTGQARGGQLLGTSHVADAARRSGHIVTALGAFRLRNVAVPTELYDLHVGQPVAGTVIDPVCRMQVPIAAAAGTLRHEGVDRWFCSLTCAAAFAAAPAHYTPDH